MLEASELTRHVALAEGMLRKATADLEATTPGLGALVIWQSEGPASFVKGKEREHLRKKRCAGIVYSDDELNSELSVVEVVPLVIQGCALFSSLLYPFY